MEHSVEQLEHRGDVQLNMVQMYDQVSKSPAVLSATAQQASGVFVGKGDEIFIPQATAVD